MKVIILGAGTFALETEDLISNTYQVVGYAVNVPVSIFSLNDKPVHLWRDGWFNPENVKLIGAMVSPKRKDFIEQCKGFDFINICRGDISSLIELGNGIIINRGVVVSAYTQIEDHVIINRGALIGHHNKIGQFATIGPGANLAGNVTIKEQAMIGMGVQILEGRTIGKGSIISAGSVVIGNIPDNSQAAGVPAQWASL